MDHSIDVCAVPERGVYHSMLHIACTRLLLDVIYLSLFSLEGKPVDISLTSGAAQAEPEAPRTLSPLHYAVESLIQETNYTGRSGCGVVRYQGLCSVTPLGKASVAATFVRRGAT